MKTYYLGGYYLIKKRPIDFGSSKSAEVFTCSNCINDSLLDNWSYSWSNQNNQNIKDVYHKLYKQTFFSHLDDLLIIGIYFDENESNELIANFKPSNESQGGIGLYENLSKKIIESESDNEKTIGFDLIGIELSGDFHTFYCHDIRQELIDKFGVTINHYGLIDEQADWRAILDYLNDEETGLEPVPWFTVKVKLITE